MFNAQLLEWNRTEADYPRKSTIADLFSAQAARTPDRLAIYFRGHALTYRELDESANRLARQLQDLGVRPDTLVGVAMGRSETLVVSLLAILKAGGAYVPLDPTYPQDRLSLVIEESEMLVLITTAASRAHLPPAASGLTVLDAEDPSISVESPQAVISSATPADLAYVIYTSGSTGKPKGVMVENRNVVNFFTGMDRALGHGGGFEAGVWLAVTSVSFDISVLELLWTLARGFTVVVHGDEGSATIAEEITRHGVTHLQMTPSLARMLTLDPKAFAALGSLKQILLGGEAVPAALIHHLRQVFHDEIYNMYGPTETTIWSTSCRVGDVGPSVSVGRPIANTQIYILNEKLNPVPAGEIGELFIGGDGVARGYWKCPELTAERFLNIPALAENRGDNRRIYRTGDMARFLPDGNIDFLGRADYQIKLRGHRIEPGEIEAQLEKCAGVLQAVVVLREDREGDQRLVAYLVAETAEAATATLRAALQIEFQAKLPAYMVPSAFVFLDALPLTGNGKIDRKALLKLPPPNFASNLASAVAAHATKPANEMERTVARVWEQALGIPSVGSNDNFFDLGAHSLTVAEVHSKLQEALGREISLIDLFQFTTVSALAAHLSGAQAAAPSHAREPAGTESIDSTLAAWWQDLLDVDHVDPDDDFFSLGGHSLIAARLLARIKRVFQVDLELAVLFKARTLRQLAEVVRKAAAPVAREQKTWSALVPIQPNGARLPLFCVHAVGGDVLFYEQLAKALGPGQPFYAFQSPIVAQPDRRDMTVEEMASLYIKEMRAFFPQGPYLLGAASYGGFVLYEMARQLHEQGVAPAAVIMFDVEVPGSAEYFPTRVKIAKFSSNIRKDGARYLGKKIQEKSTYFRDLLMERAVFPAGIFCYRLMGRPLSAPLRFYWNSQGHWRALAGYTFKPFPGKIILVRANDESPEVLGKRNDPTLGWGRLAEGGVEIIDVPTKHMFMLFEPYVQNFAETLKTILHS